MSGSPTLSRRVIGFTTIPLISIIAPLLVLPVVARVGGVDGWASVGIGQALGAFGVFTTSFGWNVIGSARVALEKDTDARRVIFLESLWTRGIAFVVTALLVGSASYAMSAPDFRWTGALTAIATALGGMTISWYGVGVSRSSLVLLYESIPMAVAMALAAAAVFLTRQIILYPAFMILGSLTGLALFCRLLFAGNELPGANRPRLLNGFRRNLGPAIVDASGGAYASAPVPLSRLTTGIGPAAGVASADRVYRLGLTVIVVIGNALQGWILERSPQDGRFHRQVAGMVAHLLLGVVGALVLVFGGRLISGVLLGAAVVPVWQVFLWYGVAFFAISTATPFIRNLLIPSGNVRIVVIATVISAIVGVSAMAVFGVAMGVVGVAFALAISELLVTCVLAVPAFRVLLRERGEQLLYERADAAGPR